MAEAVTPAIIEHSKNYVLVNALKEAGIAGLIALALFVSLIGFKAESSQQGIVLSYRWGAAIGLAALVAAVRLVFDLFVWRRIVNLEQLGRYFSSATLGTIGIAAVAFFYAAGAMFFFVDGARSNTINGIANLLGGSSAWAGNVRVAADLLSFAVLATFVIATAMMLSAAVRYGLANYRSSAPAAPRADRGVISQITATVGSQLAPALLMVAIVLPFLVVGPQQRYALDTAILVMTYIMLGWGLNVVVGLAGLLDLGYVAFYAMGAYSFALISTEFGWTFWVCLPLAGLLAAFWGIILGFPVLRLRGDYLAIVTLAFGEIIRIVLLNWYSLTNGPDGISRIPKLSFFGLEFSRAGDNTFHGFFGIDYAPIHRIIFLYYVILMLAMITNVVTVRLRRLPVGRAWEAMREDEIACRSLGISTVTTKLSAFAIGAMFGGFAGSFFAVRQGFISPESFTFQESALVLAIVVLGGLGSQIGVVIAAVVLIGSSEFFRELEQYRLLIFGACMVTLMVWKPRGLIATRTPTVFLKERKAISGSLIKEGAG